MTVASQPERLTLRSARVKYARRLAARAFRARTGQFIAEGPQAVREAFGSAGTVLEVFASQEATLRYQELPQDTVPWNVVSEEVITHIADSVHPQGLVAICNDLTRTSDYLDDLLLNLVVICHEIRDPGNLGAVIRCADAAGADAVIVAGNSVDVANPKVVRATAGSLFHLPIVVVTDFQVLIRSLAERGMQVYAADGSAETELFDQDLSLTTPTAWLMGNEAHGLPAEIRQLADRVVRVPIYGQAESLNLATAAAVCLYASAEALRSSNGRI